MKKRFPHDDLTYGVLLAALISFAFATVLDEVRSDDFINQQAVASATVVAGQTAAAVASPTAATVSAR
jgi:hypothetical protein